MLSLTDYLADPCGALSIPYWKAASITMPENMAVIHDRQFPSEHSAYRSHERYFRLFHNLRTISQTTPDFVRLVTARESDLETIRFRHQPVLPRYSGGSCSDSRLSPDRGI